MTITRISIARKCPSQNESTYSTWHAYKKEKDIWSILLRAALKPRQPPLGLVRVSLVSYRNRELDFANLIGGAKPIIDGLVRLGYLKDDAPKWMHCDYKQIVQPGPERTELTIDDGEGESIGSAAHRAIEESEGFYGEPA